MAEIKDNMGLTARRVKRVFDIVVSFSLLIVLSPVFLSIYIALRMKTGRAIIFRQERIGRQGKTFVIYKFRTMRLDCESSPQLAEIDDVRLTPVGGFLRTHHLDELPQLWNVLRGDMSFVGPRPERQFFIDQISEHTDKYPLLYQVQPGVTSLATLYNGYTDTMEKMLKRLEMDIDYLQHRTLWTDTYVILTTAWFVISGKKF
ncbi:MAG: sugar transferase [Bacteroidaceae bacterium]|nr:sugar transferase [Bacteroidaceae bacterium]